MEWLLITLCCVSIAASCGAAIIATHRVRAAEAVCKSAVRLPQSIDSRLTALAERQDAMEAVLQKIDARDRMRKVRAARVDSDDAPNPFTDPEGWKKHMRAVRAKGTA
jgi:hypothetical protein